MTGIQSFLIIASAYIVCHGITALVVTPIQSLYLSDITIFASLVYLPHGVRVLATWLWGWKAFFPLYAGGALSEIIFTPAAVQDHIAQSVLYSIGVGAGSALLAFELVRILGRNIYAGNCRAMNWKWLLVIGAIASVINSVGQSIVYSGLIVPEDAASVFLTYAAGDLIGLFVSMLALMMIFRWIRLARASG